MSKNTEEEKIFLKAAETGDLAKVKKFLDEGIININVKEVSNYSQTNLLYINSYFLKEERV
jgi:hypothetical protein